MFQVWVSIWRQWRWVPCGLAGARRDGIDWQQVMAALQLKRIPAEQWPEIESGLREMEGEALEALAELEG